MNINTILIAIYFFIMLTVIIYYQKIRSTAYWYNNEWYWSDKILTILLWPILVPANFLALLALKIKKHIN